MPGLRQSDRKLTLADVVSLTGAKLRQGAAAEQRIGNIASLDLAGAADICFLDNPKFLEELAQTHAGACLVSSKFAAAAAPPRLALLLTEQPYRAFVTVARALFPDALRPSLLFGASGPADATRVHPTARIEAGVTIDPLAVIGPRAEVGAGTVIAAGAAIGPDVCIGRHCAIGAGTTVIEALIGDRVVLHPGVRLGHDGSAYVMDRLAIEKVPQSKRAILQDSVVIGANATIERGAIRDTVVGEGAWVGSLTHVAHGARIGRHCLVGTQCGIAGGVTMGDFVVINERTSIAENVAIGDGVSIVRGSVVGIDLLAGARFDGAADPSGSGQ